MLRFRRKGGRPPIDPVLMFKVLVLPKFHGLSDEACEFQIRDRFSFMNFLGLHPEDAIPDARTIWDFKQALERDGRDGAPRLFERFDQILTEGGLIGRKGVSWMRVLWRCRASATTGRKTSKSRKGKGWKDLRNEAQRGGKKTAMRVGRRRTTRRTMGTRIT